MNGGKLRHRIILQSYTETQDAAGEPTRTYSPFATVWAEISPLTGRELENAQQISEEIDFKIKIRYIAGIQSNYRALFGTRIFEIVTALNIEERNIELKLLCKEIK